MDLAVLIKDSAGFLLNLAEVKSSLVGVASLKDKQGRRLQNASNFLGSLIGARVRLITLVGKA